MKNFCLLPALLTAAVSAASAQSISVGVKGGVPLLEPALNKDESKRYIVGPTVEIQLPSGFALEADALYQRLGSTSHLLIAPTQLSFSLVPVTNRLRGNAWEFPLLGKYYFRRESKLRPFASAGFSFRTIGIEAKGVYPVITSDGSFQPTNLKSNYRSELGVGAVFAGGVRYSIGRFSVAPEIRYTRYGNNDSLTRKNALGAFFGLTF